jgi:hypothetical protein
MGGVTNVQFFVFSLLFLVLMQNDSCGKKKTEPITDPAVAKATPPAATKEPPDRPQNISSAFVQSGVWGGAHVNLEVSDGAGNFDFDCAHGTISQSIPLDAAGKFDVPGTYSAERPGPTREGDKSQSSVRYSGTVSQDTLTLVIRRDRSNEELGHFTLIRGKHGKIMKCY